MANNSLYDSSVSQLTAQADAIGRLAQDSGGFAAVVAAFESEDPTALRWVLERLDLLSHCELICEWVRVKYSVLRCNEICRPVKESAELPSFSRFADAVVKLAGDEKALRRVVDAVSNGDADSYHAALAELKLEPFCYLFCRWVCLIVYERICRTVCSLEPIPLTDPAADIRAAGQVMKRLVANKKALSATGEAAAALDCEKTQATIAEVGLAGDCVIICGIICTWHSAWVCRELCDRPLPILAGPLAIEEARNFALAARPLVSQPRALFDLVSAVQSRDAKVYGAILTRYSLEDYCEQVCAWVGSVTCSEFCRCVCPSQAYQPMFQAIGNVQVLTDIAANGTTNKPGLGFGGPGYAFYSELQLNGSCPIFSPLNSTTGMQYRFLYSTAPPTAAAPGSPILSSMIVTSPSGASRNVLWPSGSIGHPAILPYRLIPVSIQIGEPPAGTPMAPVPPAINAPYADPTDFYIVPDSSGWVTTDTNSLDPSFPNLMLVDTTQFSGVPFGDPISPILATTSQSGSLAGNPVPLTQQQNGTDVWLTFEATRASASPTTIDTTQAPVMILVNNWYEVNNLYFLEFAAGAAGCCTPINDTLSVEFTVDHQQMAVGTWSLQISGCALIPVNPPSTTLVITPPITSLTTTALAAPISAAAAGTSQNISVTANTGFPPIPFDVTLPTGELMTVTGVAGTTWTVTRGQGGTTASPGGSGATVSWAVVVTGRGGSGIIVEDTTNWVNCSYTVTLNTEPGLTTGLSNRPNDQNQLTFCICAH
jgi:hypothetical protein